MNEACLNLIGRDISSPDAKEFSIRVLQFMKKRLGEFQEETGHLYNLEATPGEGASYRMARLDRRQYPEMNVAGDQEPYYTNSTQLPVDFNGDLFEALTLQNELQQQYTGGTVFHCFLGERIDDPQMARDLVFKVARQFGLPYFTLTPTFSVCPEHGYIRGEVKQCQTCGSETEVYSRIVGYFRPVSQWNKGKAAESQDRKVFSPALKVKEALSNVDLRNQRDFSDRLPGESGVRNLRQRLQLSLPLLP
jgi:ribonucleoside-triphosphate reductase